MEERHKCPICGKYEFETYNSLDMCDYCGWTDDIIQVKNHDYKGGGNEMSFNEAVKAYKAGKRVY